MRDRENEYKAAERRREVARLVLPGLGGIEYAIVWPGRLSAQTAALTLMGCAEHGGSHHFAVTNDGYGLAFSASGRECLVRAGLLPAEEES